MERPGVVSDEMRAACEHVEAKLEEMSEYNRRLIATLEALFRPQGRGRRAPVVSLNEYKRCA